LIQEDDVGFCKVRKNIKGKLHSLNYGKLCSVAIDPIEKKPLYMFAPGTRTLSIATVGCNFRCKFCCNWQISQESDIFGVDYTPERLIEIAKQENVQGFSYTYTEPTVFYEFSYDTAKLANQNGFYNMFVTNGYTMPEAIKKISKYLDAATIDLKGSLDPEFYRKFSDVPNVQPIYDALLAYKENKVFIEITNLLVPEHGDNMEQLKKVSKWIVENLGDKVPFHILQFFPTYKILDIPRTPLKTMEKAYKIAKKEGLKYIFIGNVHEHEWENTYCHKCRNLLVERTISGVKEFKLKKDSKCPKCGEEIPVSGIKWIPNKLWKQ
jgi:pyruvate formate lyase activating enzyme